MSVDVSELARHIDRMTRVVAGARGSDNVPPRDLSVGWMSAEAVGDGGEFASSCQNRVQWVGAGVPVTADVVTEALQVMKGLGKRRVFFRIGPRGWDEGTHAALAAAGAVEVRWVRYPVVWRDVTGEMDARTEFEVCVVPRATASAVMRATSPWFSDAGIRAAGALVENGQAELHAAFEGGRPVSVGLLMMDGEWGYLGFAGTAPEKRGRGGQSALVRSRVLRARELGAKWCTSETVTAVETSLRNLNRMGFVEGFGIRVYGWNAG